MELLRKLISLAQTLFIRIRNLQIGVTHVSLVTFVVIMGVVFSTLNSISEALFSNRSGLPVADPPTCYLRDDDYTISGSLIEGKEHMWMDGLSSMIFLDLGTRRFIWSTVENRMIRMEASQKYTTANLEDLKIKFPKWSEQKIFEAHDLFQAFEVDGDGLIEIAEMSVGLDNLGDTTQMKDRIPQLTSGDEDGTGSIDFEEFLQILYEQQEVIFSDTQLAQTFVRVNNDIKFIRSMSTVQQIRAGYL